MLGTPTMPPIDTLVRDHLQRAHALLKGNDRRTVDLREIVEQTIRLIDHVPSADPARERSKIIDYPAFRARRER